MYIKQKKAVFIRQLANRYGYIDNLSTHKDLILDGSGYVFLKVLSRKPKLFSDIVEELYQIFSGADKNELQKDADDFYKMLESKGYVTFGETPEEAENKDVGFSYARLHQTKKEDAGLSSTTPKLTEVTTLDFLNEHLPHTPNLLSVQIECASLCNERCVHCYIPHSEKTTMMDDALFEKILNECQQMGVMGITLSGGEPMTNPHFCEWLKKLQDYDFYVTVLSNLTLLTDDIIEEMKKLNSVSVQVSLYSMIPEIHDAITKLPGSFFKTVDAIFKLYKANIQVQISCPSMKLNKGHYVDVLNWAHSLRMRSGTDYIIMARSDHSTDNLENRLSLEDTEDTIRDIVQNDEEYRNMLLEYEKCGMKPREKYANEPLCGVGMSFLEISSQGNVYPCAGWWDAEIGNVKNESLIDIWEKSPKLNEFRQLRKKDIPQCLDCEDRSFCAVCMAKNANENEDHNPLKPAEHFCKVAALNHKVAKEWLSKNGK